eukprot:TRINITY_DN14315_c0_g1_i2.p1 TRINITY_DN14315_c0_g1~~TRINITY_DN14315_c0_g1_i2.p1  ORF type:complete len:282 (+),score=67.78 TRINITY_DN14315_c0_g1_i2:44-889(+)
MAPKEDVCEVPIAGVPRRVAYSIWGESHPGVPVFCVHGLTRNRTDFAVLAEALARAGRRVITVDVVGRGDSEYLTDKAQYAIPTYAGMCVQLLNALGLAAVDWVGTSMGGIIGMTVAASASGGIVRRLVLNDIGVFIPSEASNRIGTYVGKDPRFTALDEAQAYLRGVFPGWPGMADAEWAAFAADSCEGVPEGGFRLRYDPGIGRAFEAPVGDVDLTSVWDRVAAPTLLLRGALSDVLPAATAAAMAARCELVEFDGVGHAPRLTSRAEVDAVAAFLSRS